MYIVLHCSRMLLGVVFNVFRVFGVINAFQWLSDVFSMVIRGIQWLPDVFSMVIRGIQWLSEVFNGYQGVG